MTSDAASNWKYLFVIFKIECIEIVDRYIIIPAIFYPSGKLFLFVVWVGAFVSIFFIFPVNVSVVKFRDMEKKSDGLFCFTGGEFDQWRVGKWWSNGRTLKHSYYSTPRSGNSRRNEVRYPKIFIFTIFFCFIASSRKKNSRRFLSEPSFSFCKFYTPYFQVS